MSGFKGIPDRLMIKAVQRRVRFYLVHGMAIGWFLELRDVAQDAILVLVLPRLSFGAVDIHMIFMCNNRQPLNG